jgi:hypothetical protein
MREFMSSKPWAVVMGVHILASFLISSTRYGLTSSIGIFLTNMAAFGSPLYSLPHSLCTKYNIMWDAEFFLCGVNIF